jgi:hypothetical protein
MSSPHTQTALLKELLLQFHLDLSFQDAQWGALYAHLFHDKPLPVSVEGDDLLETIRYLLDLVNSEGFVCVEDLIAFYKKKKIKIRKFLGSLHKEFSETRVITAVVHLPIEKDQKLTPPSIPDPVRRVGSARRAAYAKFSTKRGSRKSPRGL